MLNIVGNNWLIFKRKLEVYMDDTGLDKHFSEDDIPADNDAKPRAIKEDAF